MGIRVRIKIQYRGSSVSTVALVNSGYETEVPEIHVPITLARKLGFSLEHLKAERYRVVGSETITYSLNHVEVRVVTEDRETGWVRAKAVSVPGEVEVLLSDALIEDLGINVLKPRSGLWRFVDEERLRKSEEAEHWVE